MHSHSAKFSAYVLCQFFFSFSLLVAGASAEFFGDIALSPFEAVKVRIQTSPPGTFPTTLRTAAPKVMF
jgi:hypothetical protein